MPSIDIVWYFLLRYLQWPQAKMTWRGVGHNRSKNAFDACFRSELLPNKAASTHVLHPGVMHCEVKVRWVSTMYERASHRVSLTDM
jgi:hypothetical protein